MVNLNRGGWIRIVETSIAIIMVLTALFFVYNKNQVNPEQKYGEFAKDAVDEIANNKTLRLAVLGGTDEEMITLNNFVRTRIPQQTLSFQLRICPSLNDACGMDYFVPGDVYTSERVISYEIGGISSTPKKIRLFIWRTESS